MSTLNEDLLEHICSLEPEMLEWMREIVEIESPTTDRDAVNRVGEWVKEKVAQLGGTLEVVPSGHPERGDHLVARFPGKDESLEPILVIAHMDTVWKIGTLESMPFRIEGNRIYGPGLFDMKGAIVFVLTALRAIQQLGLQTKRPVTCLFNSDEEINSTTSRGVIEREAKRSKYALILEGGVGDAVITSRKGILYFKLTVKGRSAHAGMDHEKGINAIEEAAHQVLAIQRKTNYARGTTVNCGIVQGGTRTNVVPAECVLEVDARVPTREEQERLIREMEQLRPVLAGTELELYTLIKRPPMERTEGVVQLYERARQIASELGVELPEETTGAISDGNLTVAHGVATLDGLGPVGDGAHAVHEHILRDRIPVRVALIARLLMEL